MRIAPLLLALALALGGCTIPQDPDGTLDRVRGGTLRVGMAPRDPWTELTDGEHTGIEVELAEGFAQSIDARIEWTDATEHELIERLEHSELDLVIGGLTMKSPWKKKAAFTRPYTEAPGRFGGTEKHVMAAPLGENAFLVELERFLLDRQAAVRERLEQEGVR